MLSQLCYSELREKEEMGRDDATGAAPSIRMALLTHSKEVAASGSQSQALE